MTETFDEAVATLGRLTHGLGQGDEARLLERISAMEAPEQLRDALVEIGARVVLGRAKHELRTTEVGRG